MPEPLRGQGEVQPGCENLAEALRAVRSRLLLAPIPTPKPGEQQALLESKMGLYRGQAGVALFLAYLGCLTGDDEATGRARWLTHEPLRTSFTEGGAFSGDGGVAYVCAHLGALWGADELTARAVRWAELDSTRACRQHDVASGTAGVVLCVAAIGAVTGRHRIEEPIRCLADRLAAMVSGADGVALDSAETGRPAAGFAHGGSGVALALATACAVTGDERYRALCADVLQADEALFWSGRTRNLSWCWGAAGLALARTRVASALEDTRYQAAAARIGSLIAQNGARPTPQCLCHGLAGSAEVLRTVGAECHAPGLIESGNQYLEALSNAVIGGRYHCEQIGPRVFNGPGLMTGLAGIGYALLRALYPGRVPCLLSLAPAFTVPARIA